MVLTHISQETRKQTLQGSGGIGFASLLPSFHDKNRQSHCWRLATSLEWLAYKKSLGQRSSGQALFHCFIHCLKVLTAQEVLHLVFKHFFPLHISAILASESGVANLSLSLGRESFRLLAGAASVLSLGCLEVHFSQSQQPRQRRVDLLSHLDSDKDSNKELETTLQSIIMLVMVSPSRWRSKISVAKKGNNQL